MPYSYTKRPIHPVIFTSPYLKTEELKVTPISEIYKRLTNGVDVGTRFIVYGMVTGIDLNHDWKYIQCNRCFKKAKLEANRYKLVITIQDNNEEMNCVLFNSDATQLLGYTVDELITKSINEGAGNPNWIVDYFIDSLIAKWLFSKSNLIEVSSIQQKLFLDDKYMGSTINEDEEKMMDDLMWGQVCETKDSLHVEVQDVPAHGIGVNTIVDEVVVSEPQVNEVHVDDA
ncbi:replication protein A 70 kDa DNA-binding subunit B [Tanacetum coccineum]